MRSVSFYPLIVAKPARRVVLIVLCGTVLVGPLVGALSLMAFSRGSVNDVAAHMGTILLAWVVAAAPVTVPGGLIGATLAIRLARQKPAPWSRLRWMVTGGFAGSAVAGPAGALYFAVLGDQDPSRLLPFFVVLGFVVGLGTAGAAYRDLESLRRSL